MTAWAFIVDALCFSIPSRCGIRETRITAGFPPSRLMITTRLTADGGVGRLPWGRIFEFFQTLLKLPYFIGRIIGIVNWRMAYSTFLMQPEDLTGSIY
jgi:hypothetical protein